MKIPIFPGKYLKNGGFSMAMLVSGRVHLMFLIITADQRNERRFELSVVMIHFRKFLVTADDFQLDDPFLGAFALRVPGLNFPPLDTSFQPLGQRCRYTPWQRKKSPGV